MPELPIPGPALQPDDPAVDAESGFIEFCQVSKSFGEHPVLKDVSFRVKRGETACILGRSGVGKSVTLKLIMGFFSPDSGRIISAGHDITGWNEDQLTAIHRQITMVFQSGALFDSLTVGENVAFALRDREDLDEEAIAAQAGRYLDLLEVGGLRDQYPSDLSTGLRRAVAIARALAVQPAAILYDEPTTMVDPLMSRRIAGLIEKVKRQVKITGIVVTHDTRLARQLADRLIFLHDGQLRFWGTVAELDASRDPVLRDFWQKDEFTLAG